MKERALQARRLYEEGWSCSQAILLAWADEFRLDHGLASRIADPLGGGMAGKGEMCGALSGALLVIGLAQGRVRAEDKEVQQRCRDTARRFLEEFHRQKGTDRCDALVPRLALSEEQLKAEHQRQCPAIVQQAAEILGTILREEGLTWRN